MNPMIVILLVLLTLAISAMVAAVLYWKKFTSGLRIITDILCKGQLPRARPSDTAVIKKLNDAIVSTFNENATQAKDLERQVKELDIQIKLVGRQKSSIEDIIYSIHDAVIVTDGFDRLSMANEAAAQLLSFFVKQIFQVDGFIGFASIDSAKFRSLVVPGDRLMLLGYLTKFGSRKYSATIQGVVGDTMAFDTTVSGLKV